MLEMDQVILVSRFNISFQHCKIAIRLCSQSSDTCAMCISSVIYVSKTSSSSNNSNSLGTCVGLHVEPFNGGSQFENLFYEVHMVPEYFIFVEVALLILDGLSFFSFSFVGFILS